MQIVFSNSSLTQGLILVLSGIIVVSIKIIRTENDKELSPKLSAQTKLTN